VDTLHLTPNGQLDLAFQTLLRDFSLIVSTPPFNFLGDAAAALHLSDDPTHGDFSSPIAFQLSKTLKKPPRVIAQEIGDAASKMPAYQMFFSKHEVAGNGFLNFHLTTQSRNQTIVDVLAAGACYGTQSTTGESAIVEFVSANPTGPLHVGHARQAALGDAIANILTSQGVKVHREFYYNDAGVQIDQLAMSVQLRAKGLTPSDQEWPTQAYHGGYIQDIANVFLDGATIKTPDGDMTASGDVKDIDGIRRFAVAFLRREQSLDLAAFRLSFDHYFLESSLYSDGKVADVVSRVAASGQSYEKDGALWLRSTTFGDDKDRVMRKSDGNYTYFVPDVAYHMDKWGRGFNRAINIQGTDHHGTVARVRAGLQTLDGSIPKDYPEYVLHSMVRVFQNGEEIKLSKRTGSYVTLRELIDWTSADAVRFFLLSRKADTDYVFDVDVARKQANDNPVFYVQYAHARICSIMRQYEAAGRDATQDSLSANLHLLTSPSAAALISKISRFPFVLTSAARTFSPHDVVFYLSDLAATYHSHYTIERTLGTDVDLSLARLALAIAVAQVLRNGLTILGITSPEQMKAPAIAT
jgi:arginyl-tRNA synthetase